MVIASDYPFLDVFWTMIIFFLWIVWFFILFRVIADLFRRHDLSGWGKTLWMIVVILLPFLGVFIYVITQGHHMRTWCVPAGTCTSPRTWNCWRPKRL